MNSSDAKPVTIEVSATTRVSGLLNSAPESKACFVVAHGAGAGMLHPFMAKLATDLGSRGIATLRYQFPYMEKHGRRPDPPALCHATVRAAVDAARALLPALPLFAGGKSFGGRMTSQAQAADPLPARCGDWRFWDFHCTRPNSRRIPAPPIYSKWKFRCCFCRARAMCTPSPSC